MPDSLPFQSSPPGPPITANNLDLSTLPTRFCTSWSQSLQHFLPLYHPTATYTDHFLRKIYTSNPSPTHVNGTPPPSETQIQTQPLSDLFALRQTAQSASGLGVRLTPSLHPKYPIYWADNFVDETVRVLFRVKWEGARMDAKSGGESGSSSDGGNVIASNTRASYTTVIEITVNKRDGLIREVEEWYNILGISEDEVR